MKKQFMRYKLIADQKVGRANRSEVLNDELLQVEKHMEHVRLACQNSYKKLSQCLQSHGQGDIEKRLKRIPENQLGNGMLDSGRQLLNDAGIDDPLAKCLQICGSMHVDMAKEKAVYELFVDDHVITPFQTMVETEIPGILKQRERLKRLVLDRDNAIQNHHKASKLQQQGINQQQANAKADLLRDELDQTTYRMEQCKDQLITEMFEFLAREAEHGQRMLDYHAKQLNYHRKCVEVLEKMEPEMKGAQEKSSKRSAYGRSIGEHLAMTGREVAAPIEACVLCIIECGIRDEGIFRIGGGASKLRKCRALADGGVLDLGVFNAQEDIHSVAGALKQYLRELPDPLLTYALHDRWIQAANIQDHDEKLHEMSAILDQLPAANRSNLRYLVKFFAHVAEFHEQNKMSASNLAVVIAPNLLWSVMDDIGTQMRQSNLITGIVETMITYADWFFPGDIEFAVTPNAIMSYANHQDHSAPGDRRPSSPLMTSSPSLTSSRISPPQSRKTQRAETAPTEEPQQLLSPPPVTGGKAGKRKKAAPPPPPVFPPAEPAKSARTKSSPPAVQVNIPPAATSNGSSNPITPPGTTTPMKPPIASKRASMRRPQLPPPPAPQGATADDAGAVKPRPRPPVRQRRQQQATSMYETTTQLETDPAPPPLTPPAASLPVFDESEEQSLPPPSLPPPPLPQAAESQPPSHPAPDQINSNNNNSKGKTSSFSAVQDDGSDDEVLMTQF